MRVLNKQHILAIRIRGQPILSHQRIDPLQWQILDWWVHQGIYKLQALFIIDFLQLPLHGIRKECLKVKKASQTLLDHPLDVLVPFFLVKVGAFGQVLL
jgi:hypothetical protein